MHKKIIHFLKCVDEGKSMSLEDARIALLQERPWSSFEIADEELETLKVDQHAVADHEGDKAKVRQYDEICFMLQSHIEELESGYEHGYDYED